MYLLYIYIKHCLKKEISRTRLTFGKGSLHYGEDDGSVDMTIDNDKIKLLQLFGLAVETYGI